VTKYESVLTQALELDEEEDELLMIRVSMSLDAGKTDPFDNPSFIAMLDRESRYADEHPESLLEWDEAEKEIFEGLPDGGVASPVGTLAP
jgi:hypothetical protein